MGGIYLLLVVVLGLTPAAPAYIAPTEWVVLDDTASVLAETSLLNPGHTLYGMVPMEIRVPVQAGRQVRVWFKHPGALAAEVNVTLAGNLVQYHDAPALWLGDIDGDNVVGFADLDALLRAYGSTPADPRWFPVADLNYDGTVGFTDAIMLLASYGRAGPHRPAGTGKALRVGAPYSGGIGGAVGPR